MSPSYCQRSFLSQPRSLLPLAVLTVVLCAPLSAATVGLFVSGKDDRPPGRVEDYARQSIPCDDPTENLTLSPGTVHVFTDTTSGQSMVHGYGCQPGWPENGPEHLYILTASEDLILDAWLADNVPDHDLILLAACHTDSCLVQANSELSATLRAGRTYYLMVDGYQGAAGPYTLTIQTRYLGLAPMICEPGGAVVFDLRETIPGTQDTTLTGASNLVSIYDCSSLTWPGGEVWYALTLAAADTGVAQTGFGSHMRIDITASTGVQSLDLALWLFDGCGPEATCLAFVDHGNAGQTETMSWRNMEPVPVTVYLAVDCRRPPTEVFFGSFSLQLGATVATERRSLSHVRDLFR